MKRLLLALILLLPRLVSAQTEGELRVQRGGTCERPVMAMNRDSLGLDTLRRIDTVGNDLMALRGAGREGNVILEVAGFGITLGRAPEPEYADVVTRSGRVKLYLFNCGEFVHNMDGMCLIWQCYAELVLLYQQIENYQKTN